MHIKLQKNGLTKEVKVGFSFTTFFFGWLVPLSRGMFAQAFIGIMTFNFASLYYMFVINRQYAEKLIADGWAVSPDDKMMALAAWGVK